MSDEIEVSKLHTEEMIKDEVRDMLGAGKLRITLGMVEGLWLVDSPYVKGGKVTESDLDIAMQVCGAEKDADRMEFHEELVRAIETACRPYELIVPDADTKDDSVGKHSEVPTFSPEWVADTISMACQAMPSLTERQILWETPFVMITHLAVSTSRRHGAITRRPDDLNAAIAELKKRNKERRKQEN